MNLVSFSLILQNNDVYYFKNNNNDAYIWILKLLSLMIGFIELVLEKNGKAVFPSIQVTESTLTCSQCAFFCTFCSHSWPSNQVHNFEAPVKFSTKTSLFLVIYEGKSCSWMSNLLTLKGFISLSKKKMSHISIPGKIQLIRKSWCCSNRGEQCMGYKK